MIHIISVFITRIWGEKAHINFPTEEDIISLALLSRYSRAIMSHEARMIINALYLDRSTVKEIMTPKSVVYTLAGNMTIDEIDIDSEDWNFSRMPVYDEIDHDNIIGIVNRRDIDFALLKGRGHVPISSLMAPPDFVQGAMPLHELLDKFINTHRHLFCVRDENNKFIGVVSLEDVIESLIGEEIVDESDIHADMQELAKKKNSNS